MRPGDTPRPGMMLVTMTRDMRPWQAGHDVLLPKAVAEKAIAEGAAVPAATAPAQTAEDKPPARYLTRAKKRK
jgi:hypothetical protein